MAKRYRQAHRARRNSRANLPAVLILVVLLIGAAVALGIWAARTWGQNDSAPGERGLRGKWLYIKRVK